MSEVAFSSVLKPSSQLTLGNPEPALRVMLMPPEERYRTVGEQANDPLVVWFALLAPHERRQIVAVAEEALKQEVG